MTNGIVAARGAGGRDFASLRLLRTGLALFFASSLTLTSVAPAFAVTSSPASPALAGLSAAPAPGLESSGEDAANVSPYDVNNAGAGLMSLMSGPEEQKSAKFEPPETPYNGAFTRSLPVEVPPFFEITPRIKLNYNSGDNRQHAGDGLSILGVGWTMSGGGLIERVVPITSPSRSIHSNNSRSVLPARKLTRCTETDVLASQLIAPGSRLGTWQATSMDRWKIAV